MYKCRALTASDFTSCESIGRMPHSLAPRTWRDTEPDLDKARFRGPGIGTSSIRLALSTSNRRVCSFRGLAALKLRSVSVCLVFFFLSPLQTAGRRALTAARHRDRPRADDSGWLYPSDKSLYHRSSVRPVRLSACVSRLSRSSTSSTHTFLRRRRNQASAAKPARIALSSVALRFRSAYSNLLISISRGRVPPVEVCVACAFS
jgi:hypothetical protein